MSNNTRLNTNVTSGDLIATEDIGGTKHELVKVEFGADGVATKVSATDPLPVTTDGLTDAELRATPIEVTGTVTVDTSTLATAAKQDTGNSSLSSILAKIITAPATEAKQDIGNTSLSTIAGKDFATQTTLALIKAKTDNIDVSLSSRTKPADQQHVIIDSGTVTVDTTGLATSTKQDTGNTSLASIDTKLTNPLPVSLPAGFATSAKQDTGNTSLASIDTKLTNPLPISGTVTTGGLTDTQLRASAVPISAATLPLPSLAATSTKQSDGTQKSQVVDGSGNVIGATSNALDINIKSGNPSTITVTQATGTNLHTVIDSGTITAVTAISNALPAGSNVIGHVINDASSAVIGHVITDIGSTTAVTGTVTTAQASPTTIFNGKTSVTTAGTRVTLAASTTVKSVTIKALSTNTGFIYVGDTSVASTNGFQLSARESVSFDLANLNTINIDSSVNGEGVTYFAVN